MLAIRIGQRTTDQLIFGSIAQPKYLTMQSNLLSQQPIDRQKRYRLICLLTYSTIFKSEADCSAALK